MAATYARADSDLISVFAIPTCDWMAFLISHILVTNYLTRPFELVLSYALTDIPISYIRSLECDNILVYLGSHRSYLCLSVASP